MPGFWSNRRVLITGHTGFKGAWMAFWLSELGAEVSGLALAPSTQPNLHDILNIPARGRFVHADINDPQALAHLIRDARPQAIIHMAAQALVRPSYAAPVETFATNVVGTVALLDAARHCPDTEAILIVTSDKVYENREWSWGYREADALGGYDPYSASKGCAEIATAAMRRSFFGPGGHAARIATARAGNVIGGGDWAPDRLVPDIVRGCLGDSGMVRIRNPASVRPWQHVLEPVAAYIMLTEQLATHAEGLDEAWNIGPEASENRPVREVAEALIAALGRGSMEIVKEANAPHEAHLLMLDCAKARDRLKWRPRLDFATTVAMTADWYAAWARGDDMIALTRRQIADFSEATS